MSDAPNKLTRRSALALMGTASAVATATVTAHAKEEPRKPPSTQKHIFGYGSLIQLESRTRTVPKAFAAWPVIVKGITRGWYYQAEVASLNPTYLGAENEDGATTNGVIYPVTDSEFAATQIRESDYLPTRIEPSAITWLDGRKATPDGEFWYFASKSRKRATAEHPIVQSYVDICVDGCLQIEEMYPLARDAHFAELFVKTCTDWKTPWINDRIFPYRPFIYMPRAFDIDKILSRYLPDDLFHKITIG